MNKINSFIAVCLIVSFLLTSGCQNTSADLNETVTQTNTSIDSGTSIAVINEPEKQSVYFSKAYASGLDDYEKELYSKTVSTVLLQDLWSERDLYDTVHVLMVPLWYAFESESEVYIKEFSNHYKKFLTYLDSNENVFAQNSGINKNHYLYLASEFITLCELYGYNEYIPEGLFEYIENYVTDYYYEYKSAWGRATGIPEILNKILGGEEIYIDGTTQPYFRAVTDNETFPLAIMANLYTIQKNAGTYSENTPTFIEAMDYTYRIFKSEVVWNSDGGWDLQPGIWTAHKDYSYAGTEVVDENTQKCPVEGISWDSSHFKRFAVFLNSYLRAQDSDDRAEYFGTLIEGLSIQFLEYVLVRPDEEVPFYRTTNYMDGSNGFYRYSYHETGVGYGPHQLSISLLQGWWTFLRNEEISKVYSDIAEQFPLNEAGKKVYIDPVTTRERNEILTGWDMLELICILSSKI